MCSRNNTRHFTESLADRVIEGHSCSRKEASRLARVETSDLIYLLAAANRLREQFKGNEITLCSIVNAQSGGCSEDCAFCAQSVRHSTGVKVYPLLSQDELVAASHRAAETGAEKFGIVTSGRVVKSSETWNVICQTIAEVRASNHIKPCASLGILSKEDARRLKEAGLTEYNHNLETAPSYFPAICTTHSVQDRINTVQAIKSAGIRVCCGGIFGLGETMEQRLELALTLRELKVDCVPMNFLIAIKGTRLQGAQPLSPQEILKIIAIFRFMLPEVDIKICAGRELQLRDLQAIVFLAGANSIMVGNLLTTGQRDPKLDLQMIADMGLTVRKYRNNEAPKE